MKTRTKKSILLSVTKWLYVIIPVAAICWVTISYLIAGYATVRFGQPFPVVELSQSAIDAILGVAMLKTAGNIFEHNDGFIFGKSREREDVHEDL